jgi:hypothetical protein
MARRNTNTLVCVMPELEEASIAMRQWRHDHRQSRRGAAGAEK